MKINKLLYMLILLFISSSLCSANQLYGNVTIVNIGGVATGGIDPVTSNTSYMTVIQLSNDTQRNCTANISSDGGSTYINVGHLNITNNTNTQIPFNISLANGIYSGMVTCIQNNGLEQNSTIVTFRVFLGDLDFYKYKNWTVSTVLIGVAVLNEIPNMAESLFSVGFTFMIFIGIVLLVITIFGLPTLIITHGFTWLKSSLKDIKIQKFK